MLRQSRAPFKTSIQRLRTAVIPIAVHVPVVAATAATIAIPGVAIVTAIIAVGVAIAGVHVAAIAAIAIAVVVIGISATVAAAISTIVISVGQCGCQSGNNHAGAPVPSSEAIPPAMTEAVESVMEIAEMEAVEVHTEPSIEVAVEGEVPVEIAVDVNVTVEVSVDVDVAIEVSVEVEVVIEVVEMASPHVAAASHMAAAPSAHVHSTVTEAGLRCDWRKRNGTERAGQRGRAKQFNDTHDHASLDAPDLSFVKITTTIFCRILFRNETKEKERRG